MYTCKHCKQDYDNTNKPKGWAANHSRWCDENPKRKSYSEALVNARNAKTNFNNQYTYGAKCSEETKEKIRISSIGKRHSEDSKRKISEKALASKHRRLVRSIRNYTKKDGTIISLDSSWEEALAKRLDSLDIEWIRPEIPIPYVYIDGKTHNYFPDFYLPEYNMFLDPKNPAAYKAQHEKIKILMKTIERLFIIESLTECKEFDPNLV